MTLDKSLSRLLMLLGFTVFLFSIFGCVSVPLPPSGDDAGKYGYLDFQVRYRPNFDTIVSTMSRPNPDIATLRDK